MRIHAEQKYSTALTRAFSIVLALSLILGVVPSRALADGSSSDAASDDAPALTESEISDISETMSSDIGAEGAVRDFDAANNAVDFFYVDSTTVTLGNEQYVAIGLAEGTGASSFWLTYEKLDGDTKTIESTNVEGDAALFSIAFEDESETGGYKLKSIDWDGPNAGAFNVPDPEGGVSFSVQEATDKSGGDVTVSLIDENEQLVELDSIPDAINESIRAEETAEVAAQAASRSIFAPEVAMAATDPNSKMVIALDPGHGGSDPGACANGLREKDLNLQIAKYCKTFLNRNQEASAFLTRSDDIYLGLEERVNIAKSKGATLFVSIHINAGGGTGFEIWIQNDSSWRKSLHNQGQGLAKTILAKLSALGLPNRGVWESDATNGETYPDGSVADYLTVINESRRANMPGILIEHGFIDSADASKLQDTSFLKQMAKADAEGIIAYFGMEGTWEKGSDGKWRWKLSDGTYATDKLLSIGGKTYYIKPNGVMCTGLRIVNDNVYYFDKKTGAAIKSCWKKVSNKWYYFKSNGLGVKSNWLKKKNKWYYFGKTGQMWVGLKKIDSRYYYLGKSGDGAMQTGWKKLSGKWYYFKKATGAAIQDNWLTKKGKRYYFGSDGKMYSGFKQIGENKYLFAGANDGSMKFGWNKIGGKWYYFSKSNGVMLKNRWISNKYWLGPDGAWIENYQQTPIMGMSYVSAARMAALFEQNNPNGYPYTKVEGYETPLKFFTVLIEEAEAEGVRADVVAAQAMLETGWLKFGGDVKKEQYNFAGIGAVGGGAAGAKFDNIRQGLRAQVQHLKAYASTEPLKQVCVDPRFSYVTRGSAQYVEWLGIQENPNHIGWASGENYGPNILAIIQKF